MSPGVIDYAWDMARWQPDARGRLQQAALDPLRRAGLRQHDGRGDRRAGGADQANVLPLLRGQARGAVLRGAGTRAAVRPEVARRPRFRRAARGRGRRAGRAAPPCSREGREYARRRQQIIAANPELQERELIKLASLAGAVAEALRERGVRRPGRDPHRRGGHHGLQGRVRALGRPGRRKGPPAAHPRVAAGAQDGRVRLSEDQPATGAGSSERTPVSSSDTSQSRAGDVRVLRGRGAPDELGRAALLHEAARARRSCRRGCRRRRRRASAARRRPRPGRSGGCRRAEGSKTRLPLWNCRLVAA